ALRTAASSVEPLALDQETSGAASLGGSVVYAFTLPTDAVMAFDMRTSGDAYWRLRDEAGRALFDGRARTNEDRGPLPLLAGDYTLELYGPKGAAPSWTFWAGVAPNHDAVPAAFDTPVASAIEVPGET